MHRTSICLIHLRSNRLTVSDSPSYSDDLLTNFYRALKPGPDIQGLKRHFKSRPIVLQAHVPDVPSAYLRDGPDGGLHAHDGLHPGRRQAIQVIDDY